jgi:hypothetical protein
MGNHSSQGQAASIRTEDEDGRSAGEREGAVSQGQRDRLRANGKARVRTTHGNGRQTRHGEKNRGLGGFFDVLCRFAEVSS